ncbi:FmdB family zinc ribbon protein [Rothia sp. P6271]|uniref:FmdB family zinc ribbon protein n=1 Tax=unclassified Rothia (in: high G+C Gram-positive bacteria) TaxID=2689056 RepID=UPI003ACD597C
MPVYQYQCKNCEYLFEEHQSFTDKPLTTCPQCNADQLRKKYGTVGVVFKGSGFYSNDKSSS